MTQIQKIYLQRILAWYIIDNFQPSLDLISQTRKSLPQTDKETFLADETDFIWDNEWSHKPFLNIPSDISRGAIAINSVHRDF